VNRTFSSRTETKTFSGNQDFFQDQNEDFLKTKFFKTKTNADHMNLCLLQFDTRNFYLSEK